MKRGFLRNLLGVFFLTIFFLKIGISFAPLVIPHFDSKTMSSIMLEFEGDDCEKSPEKIKDCCFKGFYSTENNFSFINPLLALSIKAVTQHANKHLQLYYPSVPTPPPSV